VWGVKQHSKGGKGKGVRQKLEEVEKDLPEGGVKATPARLQEKEKSLGKNGRVREVRGFFC